MMNQILAGIAGGVIFIVFFVVLDLSIILSVIAALAGFGGGLLLFAKTKKSDQQLVTEFITESKKKVNEILIYRRQINNSSVGKKIQEIGFIYDKIFSELQRDPKDVKVVRQVLVYYLDSTLKIVKKYTYLSQQMASPEIESALLKVEEALDNLKLGLEKQLMKLLEDDMIDLDTELSVLNETIKMEDL